MKKYFVPTLIILLSFYLILFTSLNVFEKIPHSQDEVAYLFQAKIFKSGHLFLESFPSEIRRFFDHEFIINNNHWYGKYSPGESIFLAFGMLFNATWLVNPIFSLLSLILLFLLAKKMFSYRVALLSLIMFSISPFFLLISASYLSHPSALFFTLLFFYSLISIYKDKQINKYHSLLNAVSIGMIFIIRPYNSISLMVILLFVFILKIFGLKRRVDKTQLILIFIKLIIIIFSFIVAHLIYNKILTGNLFTFPHLSYFKNDFIGFGARGVEWNQDFSVKVAINNLINNFMSFKELFFFFPIISLIIFVLLSFLKNKIFFPLILLFYFTLQIVSYFFYFHPGTFLGPRYWFEASWVMPILFSQGLSNLLNIFKKYISNEKVLLIYFIISFIIYLLTFDKDVRIIKGYKGHNGMSKITLPSIKKPALVFVEGEKNWQAYGQLFINLNPIIKNNEIIFARHMAIHNVPKNLPPLKNELLIQYFPNRYLYIYRDGRLEDFVRY